MKQMDDLISRKALLNHLSSWQMEQFAEIGHEKEYNLLDMIIRGIENEPSVNQWIPCSERLPKGKEAHKVLVTDEDGIMAVCYFLEVTEVFKVCWDGEEFYGGIAWQPLHEAYKGE